MWECEEMVERSGGLIDVQIMDHVELERDSLQQVDLVHGRIQ